MGVATATDRRISIRSVISFAIVLVLVASVDAFVAVIVHPRTGNQVVSTITTASSRESRNGGAIIIHRGVGGCRGQWFSLPLTAPHRNQQRSSLFSEQQSPKATAIGGRKEEDKKMQPIDGDAEKAPVIVDDAKNNATVPPSPTPAAANPVDVSTAEESAIVVSNVTEASNNNSTNSKSSSSVSSSSAESGIGGMGGVVYDVNRLKRNLLQETMKAFKLELFDLLDSPSAVEEEIVNKLAALVQVSPVRTTTDSNLLEGTWCLAYRSRYCSAAGLATRAALTDTVRPLSRRGEEQQLLQRRASNLPGSRRRGGKEAGWIRSMYRTFHLEDLEDDEDAYVVDTTNVLGTGSLLRQTRTSVVRGLTRKSMRLCTRSSEWFALGRNLTWWSRADPERLSDVERTPYDMSVVYLDVDLCILANEGSPFVVYTKNEEWIDPKKRLERRLRIGRTSLRRFVRPVMNALFFWKKRRSASADWSGAAEEDDLILREIPDATGSKLRVLKLGAVNDREDDDEGAWGGVNDPFVHLTADERQQVLKEMNVREIEKAGNRRLSKSRRERWLGRLFFGARRKRRKTYFKGPDDLS